MTDNELLERYPFLRVDPEYNYIDTPEELYSEEGLYIPKGWRELFLKCCEELRDELIKINKLDEFKINQLKEKYGSMRIYTNISDPTINDIINRYEIISQFTCCECGKIATVETTGWICPYCDECVKDENVRDKYRPISDYICLTKFEGDKTHKHYYSIDNLPYKSVNENECYIEAKDGSIICPKTWIEKFLESIDTKEKTVREISDEIEEIRNTNRIII